MFQDIKLCWQESPRRLVGDIFVAISFTALFIDFLLAF